MDLMMLWIIVFVVGLIVIIPMSLTKQKQIHEQRPTIYRQNIEQAPQYKKSFEYRQDDEPTFDPRKFESITEEERQKHDDQYKNAFKVK